MGEGRVLEKEYMSFICCLPGGSFSDGESEREVGRKWKSLNAKLWSLRALAK